jgi:protein-S-isoprenylcysteine O-methyltransferase Ste14
MNFLLLIEFWVLYFFIHSFLASEQVKNLFERWLGRGFRLYRLAYSFISTIGLLFLLLFNASLSSELLFTNEGLIRYLSLMLATFGVIVISQSFREYRFSSFIGLRDEPSEFKKTGVLKFVRHPIYSGTILIVIGFFLFNPTRSTLISVCCILSYLPIGIYLEERKLIKHFGDLYQSYKKEVPSVFPKIRKGLFQKTSQ